MPGLNLITGNHLEILIGKLADLIAAQPLRSSTAPETIIVQSNGMARWITLELAERHGICANYDFPFPNAFIDNLSRIFSNDHSPETAPDMETLTWLIMAQLASASDHPEFGVVRNYLKDDDTGIKLYQLSRQVADLFDQYTVYRPQMVLEWERKNIEHWQAILWKKLSGANSFNHRAKQFDAIFQNIVNYSTPPKNLPERIHIFGISSLPPVYVQLLEAVAQLVDINLFVMNPCRHYWADILSDREQEKLARKLDKQINGEDHVERGNSLLASMAKQGRDFFYLLAEYDEDAMFKEPGQDSLLTSIQSDILNLIDRGKTKHPGIEVKTGDRSVQFHNCHSPMREVEVLYDNLLDMFDSDPRLLPKDILVMAPDIETYAPFVQAVFDNPENEARRIPFTIADRSPASENRIIETFMSIIGLVNSRYEVSKIIDILERDIVCRKFLITSDEIELVHHWLRSTNVRWGYDGRHKTEIGLPEILENTWRFGLNRLLLGNALPGKRDQLYRNILPFDDIEGDSAQTLGKFTEFAECLFGHLRIMKHNHRLDEWSEILLNLCNDLFISDNEAELELQTLRETINRLNTIAGKISYDKEVNIEIIKQHLADSLGKPGHGFGFIAGSVTFCAMLPMRSIPFKIICLLGMNNDSYPRQAKHLSFDLMAQKPQPGDRSVRHTDRYIFLETILSSRQTLYISYSGQSIQDNSAIPPSVLVSELIDYIDQGFTIEGKPAADRLITEHRLQAFSDRYFTKDSPLYSYSSENREAAEARLMPITRTPAFLETALPEADESMKKVDIAAFCRFFSNPAKYLLNSRLGIYLDDIESGFDDDEPYAVKGLERYKLDRDLLDKCLEGRNLAEYHEIVKASGVLPHGLHGRITYDTILRDVNTLADKIRPYRDGLGIKSPHLKFNHDGYTVGGKLANLTPSHYLNYRPAGVKSKDILSTWIINLMLGVSKDTGVPRKSVFIGNDKLITFKKIDDSASLLTGLISLFDMGLRRPLPFFPETSLCYASDIVKGKSEDKALAKCLRIWRGGKYSDGEGKNPYYTLCFERVNPLTDEFRDLSLKIFKPILDNLIETK